MGFTVIGPGGGFDAAHAVNHSKGTKYLVAEVNTVDWLTFFLIYCLIDHSPDEIRDGNLQPTRFDETPMRLTRCQCERVWDFLFFRAECFRHGFGSYRYPDGKSMGSSSMTCL